MSRTFYVLFGDGIAGGYGYWLSESEEQLKNSIKGERDIDVIQYGSFPTEMTICAEDILRNICSERPPDENVLSASLSELEFEDNFDKYNDRILKMVEEEGDIRRRVDISNGHVKRFEWVNKRKDWSPIRHSGYTIITPCFDREKDDENIATYKSLEEIQNELLKSFPSFAPAPKCAFHLTIADLISGERYEEIISDKKDNAFLFAISSIFNHLKLRGSIKMKVKGISILPPGFVIAPVSAEDNDGYIRLNCFRNNIYIDKGLKNYGVNRKYKFTGHITLAYIEKDISTDNVTKDHIYKSLNIINKNFKQLPLNVKWIEVCQFDDMKHFNWNKTLPFYSF
jgi:hypothetical protein